MKQFNRSQSITTTLVSAGSGKDGAPLDEAVNNHLQANDGKVKFVCIVPVSDKSVLVVETR